MKSPFKVMSTAALAAAVAVPTLSVPAADAAETTSFHSVALETEDGSVVTVPFTDYAQAKTFGTGELGEFVASADVTAVSAEEGQFVTIRTLAMAKIENPEADTVSLLDELDNEEDNLVSDEEVAEYTTWEDMGDDAEAAVESVSANNLKEVEVEFNTDVEDNEEAVNVDNYSLGDIDLADVRVDGNNVTLILDGNVDQQTDATLTVSANVLGEEEEFDFQFSDTTIPQALDAEVNGIRTVKVSFSEPVTHAEGSDLKDGFELSNDNGSFNIDDVVLQNGGKEARVSFYSDFEDGVYELSTTNELEDYAGYSVTPKTFEVEVDADEDAPELVDYRSATKNQVTLVYNEDVAFEDENAMIIYHGDSYDAADFEDEEKEVSQNNDLVKNFYHTNSSNTASKVEIDGNEVTLSFDSAQELPSGSAYVYVGGDSVKDLWDNVQEGTERITTEVTLDEEPATVSEVAQVDGEQDQFTVEFSESVNEDSATDLDNYTVLDSDGEEVELDGAELNGETVTLSFEEDQIGTFTLVVEDVEDLAGNQTANAEFDLDMKNIADLDVSEFEGKFYQEDDNVTITVAFDRQMKTEGSNSVLDLSAYQIGGVVLDEVDGASIKSVNNDQGVEITLDDEEYETAGGSADFAVGGDASLNVTMSRVEDVDGNRSEFTDTFDIANGLATDINEKSVNLVDNDTVEVVFNGDLTDFDGDEFAIGYDNGTEFVELPVGSVTQNALNKATFTLTEDLSDAGNPYDADGNELDEDVVIRTVDSDDNVATTEDTHNEYGVGVNLSDVSVEDKLSPELVAEDEAADYNSGKDITLTFTESLSLDPSYAATDIVISEEDGTTLTANDYTVAGDSTENLVITLDSDYEYDGELTVSTDDSVEYITDGKGNAVDSFEIELVDQEFTTTP